MNNFSEVVEAIKPFVEALEDLGVPYHIGGSVASSIYGILRATIDTDLVADLRLEQVRPLVNRVLCGRGYDPRCYPPEKFI